MSNNPRHLFQQAQGDFFVTCTDCLICEVPCQTAPTLIKFHQTNDDEFCYFYKQPETEEEIELAIEAIDMSCIAALMYRGNNPEIIKKLEAKGLSDRIEKPKNG